MRVKAADLRGEAEGSREDCRSCDLHHITTASHIDTQKNEFGREMSSKVEDNHSCAKESRRFKKVKSNGSRMALDIPSQWYSENTTTLSN